MDKLLETKTKHYMYVLLSLAMISNVVLSNDTGNSDRTTGGYHHSTSKVLNHFPCSCWKDYPGRCILAWFKRTFTCSNFLEEIEE